MPSSIVVVGAGGHGIVVADALLECGEHVLGFLDDHLPAATRSLDLPVLGPITWLQNHDARVALGIGTNEHRARAAKLCRDFGRELVAVVHPRASVAKSAVISDGAVVLALAVVNANAQIETGAIINSGAVIEHDCSVGEFAHVSPNATMSGNCHVAALAQLGAGAVMIPGTRVGRNSLVGAGAAVTCDLPPDVVAVGVPARVCRSVRTRT